MSRPKNPVPRYLLHKTSGQARVVIDGRDVYLGVHGSPASFAAYAKLVAELKASHGPQSNRPGKTSNLTVDEVLLAFWKHAGDHYRRADGTPTSEVSEYRQVLKVVRSIYGTTPAVEFGPLALKAVRERMIELGWSRSLVNARVNRVRRLFKWAASEELVAIEVYQALTSVTGLQKNRSKARETEPVEAVPVEHVNAVLPHLPRPVRGMVELQLASGMRPGEVCSIRPDAIDTTGEVWIFRPPHHKLKHKNKPRAVALGPRSQAILKAFMPTADASYFFSPRESVAEFHAARTAKRKVSRFPSNERISERRRVASPGRRHAERYTTTAYDRAIARAVVKAIEWREQMAGPGNFEPVPHWAPNQLRHAHGTAVRRVYGLEGAQVVLGHTHATVTEIYAEKNLALATTIAAAMS